MPKNSVYAQTQTKENYKSDTKITAKQWKIYYYMLSQSKYSAEKVEDHRYIYKKDFNISKACRELGIKSNQTFYNAMGRLKEHHLIKQDNENFYLYAKNYIAVDKKVLMNLLNFAKMREQDIDLLRVFLILKKMDSTAHASEDRSFTTRILSILLGHGDTSAVYYSNIRIYLALLSFWGLIELKQHKQYDEGIGAYTIFHLQTVKETNLSPDFEMDIEAEMAAPQIISEEMMEKLRFTFPNILEN